MRGHVIAIAGLLVVSGHAWAGSGAKFTLGLSGEYLSDSQEYEGVSLDRSNLQTILGLTVVGHVVDPRFMTFEASIAKALSDQDLSNQPDSEVDETSYTGGLRLFNNRPVSLEVDAGHQATDVTGLQQGAVLDGTRDFRRYALRALGGDRFRLNLRHSEQVFSADDPTTLRDEDTTWSELSAQASTGKVDAMMQLLWRESDIFSGALQQQIGSGRVDLDVNREGRVYWHTDLVGSLYRSARGDGQYSPWTRNYSIRNQLRHRFSELGFWDLRANAQVVETDSDPAEQVVTGDGSWIVVAPVAAKTFVESEVGYLTSEYGEGQRLTQPRAALGVRWGSNFGRWWVSVNPRLTYVRADPEGLEEQSSLGAFVFATVRYQLASSSVTFEGEYYDNQLSIPEDAFGGAPIATAFLVGLDRRRYRGRVILDVRPSARTAFTAEGDYRHRVRVDRDTEVTEEVARAQLTVVLGPVAIGASGDRFEVTGGDIPSLTDVWQANVSWRPAYWLLFDALFRSEERQVFDFVGTYEFSEIGMQLNYAKLSFYARVREQQSNEAGLDNRRFRRLWVGLRRLFDFRVGEGVR